MPKIALFGVGHLGKIHCRLLKEIPEWEITGIYDPDEATASKVAKEFDVPYSKDPIALIQSVDAVDIVSPTSTHFEVAKMALQAGKHLFVEKPLCSTVKEGKALLDLWQKHPVVAQVGHVERFNPAWLSVKDRLGVPKFIEVHRLAQFNPRGTDVSVVLDLMIHDLDIIASLVQSPVIDIAATGVPIVSKTADIANARITFANQCVANVTASRLSLKNMRKIRIFQGDAYVSMDFLEKKSEIVQIHNEANPLSNGQPINAMPLVIGPDQETRYISFEQPEAPSVNAIKMELQQFEASISRGEAIAVSLADGFRALELAESIENALETY